MLNLCLNCECVQILIFRGDIHVNGNGRDTYKFRAIHPLVNVIRMNFERFFEYTKILLATTRTSVF